jgi:hypothetical protein
VLLLGSREDNAHLGYVQGRCPRCGANGYLGVYLGKRKVTFAALVALPVAEQLFLECMACNSRFGVPPEREAEIRQHMVSRERLASFAANAPYLNQPAAPSGPQGRTAYRVLQVDPSADPEVIQAAFKRLAMKYHPDRSRDPDAAERMRELTAAHDILTDPDRRAAYDRSIGIERPVVHKRPPAMRPDEV